MRAAKASLKTQTQCMMSKSPKRGQLENPTRTRSKKKPRCWPFFPNRPRRWSPQRLSPARALGEIRGFTWQNYDGSEIRVEKSVWRSHVDEPKRPKSKGAIPVIAQLKLLLDQHWESCGRPPDG